MNGSELYKFIPKLFNLTVILYQWKEKIWLMNSRTRKKKESVITVLLEHGLKARAVVPKSQAKITVTPTYILRFTVF